MGRCSIDAASTTQCSKHRPKQSKRGKSSMPSSAVCAMCLRERLAKLICEGCGGIITHARDSIIASSTSSRRQLVDDTPGNKCVCNHDKRDQHKLSAVVQVGDDHLDHDCVKGTLAQVRKIAPAVGPPTGAVKDISTGIRSIASLIENDILEAAAAAAGSANGSWSRPNELTINTETARLVQSYNINAPHEIDGKGSYAKEMTINTAANNYGRWKAQYSKDHPDAGMQWPGLTKSKSTSAAAGVNDNLIEITNNYSSTNSMLGSCTSGAVGGGGGKRANTPFWGKLFSGVGRRPAAGLGKINFRRSRSVASSSSDQYRSSSADDLFFYGPAASSSSSSSLISSLIINPSASGSATPLINRSSGRRLWIKGKYNVPGHSDHAAADRTYNYSTNWGKSSCCSWLRHVAGALRSGTHLYSSAHHARRDDDLHIATNYKSTVPLPPLMAKAQQLHLLHADDGAFGAAANPANQSSNPMNRYTDHTITSDKGAHPHANQSSNNPVIDHYTYTLTTSKGTAPHVNHSSDTVINYVPDAVTTVINCSNYSSPSSAPNSSSSSSLLSSPTDHSGAASRPDRSDHSLTGNAASISSLILLATQGDYKSSATTASRGQSTRGLRLRPHCSSAIPSIPRTRNILSASRKKDRTATSTMVSVAS